MVSIRGSAVQQAREIWNKYMDKETRAIMIDKCCSIRDYMPLSEYPNKRFERLPKEIQHDLIGFIRYLGKERSLIFD